MKGKKQQKYRCFTPQQMALAVRLDVNLEVMNVMTIRSRLLTRQLVRLSYSQQLFNYTFRNAATEAKDTLVRSIPAAVVGGMMGAVGTLAGPQVGFVTGAIGSSIGGELTRPLTSRTGTHTQLYPTCAGNTVDNIYQEALRTVKDNVKSFPKWKEFCREFIGTPYVANFCIDTAMANAPDVSTSMMRAGMDLTKGSFTPMLQLTANPLCRVLGSTVSHSLNAGLDPGGIYRKGKDTVRAWVNFHPGPHGGGRLCVDKLTKLLKNHEQYMIFLKGVNIVSQKLLSSLESSIRAERSSLQGLPESYFDNVRTDFSARYEAAEAAIAHAVKSLQLAIFTAEQRAIDKKEYRANFAQYDA